MIQIVIIVAAFLCATAALLAVLIVDAKNGWTIEDSGWIGIVSAYTGFMTAVYTWYANWQKERDNQRETDRRIAEERRETDRLLEEKKLEALHINAQAELTEIMPFRRKAYAALFGELARLRAEAK